MSLSLPFPTILLMIYMWISMTAYLFLIYIILILRKRVAALRSSYYSLFFLEAMGNFFVFLHYELVLRPRKYNFFNLYHEEMTWFAIYSMTMLFVGRGVWFLSEIFIAANRFTIFYIPLQHEKLWSTCRILCIYLLVWTVSILAALPFAFNSKGLKFVFAPNGILQMYGGSVYDSVHSVVLMAAVVLSCTFFYGFAFRKARNESFKKTNSAIVERHLFVCALFSALPTVAEFARSAICGYATVFSDRQLYALTTEWGLYQVEIMASLPVWLQLLVNVDLRKAAIAMLMGRRRNTASSSFQTHRISIGRLS